MTASVVFNYAIEITTDSAVTYGPVYSGVIRVVTGRPGFNGTPVLTGDAPSQVWAQGWLAAIGGISRRCNPESGGEYATLSGFSFSLVNVLPTPFGGSVVLQLLFDLVEIYLYTNRVRVYQVQDLEFTQCWEGVIEKVSFDEHEYNIECVDYFKALHTNVPPSTFDKVRFPGAIDSIIGSPVPMSLGYVTKAKLFPIQSTETRLILYSDNVTLFNTAIAQAYSHGKTTITAGMTVAWVTMYTGYKQFALNELTGSFLSVVANGPKQAIRILANDASTGYTAVTGVTIIYIEYPFTEAPTVGGFSATYTYEDRVLPTFFEIYSFELQGLVSNGQIKSFEKRDGVNTQLDFYDSGSATYQPIDAAVLRTDLGDLESQGFPGISLVDSLLDAEGYYHLPVLIQPSSAKFQGKDLTGSTYGGGTMPTIAGNSMPNFVDRSRSTGYDFTWNGTPSQVLFMNFEIKTADLIDVIDLDDLQIAIDMSRTFTLTSTSTLVQDLVGVSSVTISDFLGNNYSVIPQAKNVCYINCFDNAASPTINIHGIPDQYYDGVPGLITTRHNKELRISIKQKILGSRMLAAFSKITIRISIQRLSFASKICTYSFNEIALIGDRKLLIKDKASYAKVIGEIRGTDTDTWGPGDADPIITGVDAISYLIRKYDIGYSNPDYATLTARYIDQTSFNAALDQREAWYVGQQLSSRKNNIDWIEELLKILVAVIVPNANGSRALKCWLDNTTTGIAFSDSTNIVRDSIKSIRDVGSRKVFNDFSVKYDKDPGSGNYKRHLFITKTNEDAFPGVTDVDGFGNLLWKQFVGGYETYAYALADWTVCHNAWLKTKTITPWVLVTEWCFHQQDWFPADPVDTDLPKLMLSKLLPWLTAVKRRAQFELDVAVDAVAFELMDPCTFSDAILTSGYTVQGWISEISINPSTDKTEIEVIYAV